VSVYLKRPHSRLSHPFLWPATARATVSLIRVAVVLILAFVAGTAIESRFSIIDSSATTAAPLPSEVPPALAIGSPVGAGTQPLPPRPRKAPPGLVGVPLGGKTTATPNAPRR
jgi:hypothetical protein